MKERIIQFLKEENKSSAQFAEEIGVQPSGISHIISGRNNPSLEFITKMLERYNYLSTDWLLFGKGEMYGVKHKQFNLFTIDSDDITPQQMPEKGQTSEAKEKNLNKKNVSKIVWFYDDNTFEEFTHIK